LTEFDKIYKAYFNDVFLYIMKLSGDENLADEVTSETFFKAMRAIGSFRGDCDIRVWLCQIAKNTYYSVLKKQNRLKELDESEAADLQFRMDLEETVIIKEKTMNVHMHLHDLPEPYKEVFMLRVFGELNFKQIGDLFSKTENWACVTYYRAKNKIIEKMEDHNYEK
jgi:RNA polymerase sigma factor (sigma-70 family)